jgi:DNA-directed RNA polymerase alpha subunit
LSFGFKEVEISNGDFVLTIQKDKGGGIGEYQIWVDLGIENETNEITISLVCDSQWLITKNKYIHQLQNLYFALTQKELKLRNNIKVLIEDSDMSVRLINCLKNNVNFSCNKQVPVITYLDEISNYTKKEVYEIFGLRAKKMKELQEVMLRFDIEFKEE